MTEERRYAKEAFSHEIERDHPLRVFDLFYSPKKRMAIVAGVESWGSRMKLVQYYVTSGRADLAGHIPLECIQPLGVLQSMRFLGEWQGNVCVQITDTEGGRRTLRVFNGHKDLIAPPNTNQTAIHPDGRLMFFGKSPAEAFARVYGATDEQRVTVMGSGTFEHACFLNSGSLQTAALAVGDSSEYQGSPAYFSSEDRTVLLVAKTGEVWLVYWMGDRAVMEKTNFMIPPGRRYHSHLTALPKYGLCFVEQTDEGVSWRFGGILHPGFKHVTDLVLTAGGYGYYFAVGRSGSGTRLYRMNIG